MEEIDIQDNDIFNRLQRLFKFSLRPMPKFQELAQAAAIVEEQYGAYGLHAFDPARLLVLHRLVSEKNSFSAVPPGDERYIGRLLFLDADKNHKAFYPNEKLCDEALRIFDNIKDDDAKASFLRDFCAGYAPFHQTSKLRSGLSIIAQHCTKGIALFRIGLFWENPIQKISRFIAKDGLLSIELPKISVGLIRADSPIARQMWFYRIHEYKALITEHIDDSEKLRDVLSFILHDSQGEDGTLRWPGHENQLADALLSPYLEQLGTLPSKEIEDLLSSILLRFFGNPEDPEARWRWADIEEKWKHLLEHWLRGRQLNGALELVHELTSPKNEFIHQWEERERYWKEYWKAGRIRNSRVYFRSNIRRHPDYWDKAKNIQREYGGKLDLTGTFSGNGGNIEQMVLLLQIDDNILAAEVNFNGSLRIGYCALKERLSLYERSSTLGIWRNYIDYSELNNLDEGIRHVSGWQRTASIRIEKLSGRRAPNGTMH